MPLPEQLSSGKERSITTISAEGELGLEVTLIPKGTDWQDFMENQEWE